MNTYIPEMCEITAIRHEAPKVKTFFIDWHGKYEPGQFVELSVLGYGEAPISVSSRYGEPFALTVREVGSVTGALHRMSEGDQVGIRGPFGTGWPMKAVRGRNLVIVAGGIGLAPLRPVIKEIIANRDEYGKVILLYGARSPWDILYRKEMGEWLPHINVEVTVDRSDVDAETMDWGAWKGKVGLVTRLLEETEVPLEDAYAFVCGPPIMMRFVARGLIEKGFTSHRIYVSLERNMKCGMGMCGHCQLSGRYVCLDGPVFRLEEALRFIERPEETAGVIG